MDTQKNQTIPVFHIQQLISRMTAPPELKEILTKNLQSRDHSQTIRLAEINRVFEELKLSRAGTSEAFHIDKLHKDLTAHLHTNAAPGSLPGPSHPLLSH